MDQQDSQLDRKDSRPPQSGRPSKPAQTQADPPDESAQGNRTDWLGWVLVILVFLVVNCFLLIYCYWIFLPYPRW